MKTKLLFLFLLFGQIAFAQSEKLTKVPGTKCSMIPPEGFITSSTFSGFQDEESGASIMINELPAPYKTMADGFTAEALKPRGMTLLSKQTIDHNGSKATIIHLSQPANGTTYLKQILIFGDPKHTVLVNGIYPEESKEIEREITNALLSTIYNAAQDEKPLDAATFTIDVSGTDFKLIKYMSGGLLYSTDGKIPTEKPTFMVANSISKAPLQNQKKYAEERLKKHPRGEQNVIREIKEITIDNLKGYEIVADGKTKNDKPELTYQVMLFNDEGDYYIIIGQAKEEFQKNSEAFKKIANTFKRK